MIDATDSHACAKSRESCEGSRAVCTSARMERHAARGVPTRMNGASPDLATIASVSARLLSEASSWSNSDAGVRPTEMAFNPESAARLKTSPKPLTIRASPTSIPRSTPDRDTPRRWCPSFAGCPARVNRLLSTPSDGINIASICGASTDADRSRMGRTRCSDRSGARSS